MSSPAPPPPLAPGTVVAGLTIEPSGSITWQWVTFFIVGNLFAGFWLVLAFLNAYPEVAYQARLALARLGLAPAPGGRHGHGHGGKPHGEEGEGGGGGEEQGAAQQQQQQQDEGAGGQQQQAGAARGVLPPPALVVRSPTGSRGAGGASPGSGELVSSPLRSHRSRPLPPPALVVEQSITPRASYTPKLAAAGQQQQQQQQQHGVASPRSSGGGGNNSSSGNGHAALLSPGPGPDGSYPVFLTPVEGACHATTTGSPEAGAGGGGAGAASGSSVTDSSLFTEESSLEGEPDLVSLEWRNLCYAVKGADGPRMIVQGIYGCANAQELQGLMGPSGAGKSTLMDLLSQRTDPVCSSSSAGPAAAGHDDAAAAAAAAAHAQHDAADDGEEAHGGWQQRMRGWLPGGGGASSQQQQQKRSSDGTSSSLGDGATSSASADAAVLHVPLADDQLAAAKRQQEPRAAGPGVEAGLGASQLLVNGAPMGRKAFMKISAYVPQHDNLVPTMTALEALSFYAAIILPPETSAHKKKARIARVLAMMGLTHHSHTLVGGTLPGGILMRGLSGGEKKRLAIACGVVAGPRLVFLDEPTSGLDSFAALNVVLFLKSMATQNGATLVASLHQPRSAIWGQLDQVTLLANGRLMYTGPTGALVGWFTSLGYAYDPSTHGMASDWALDLVSLGFAKPQQQQQQQQRQGEQEEEGARASSPSMRQRGAAAGSSSSRAAGGRHAQQQQQQQWRRQQQVSQMSSKQELSDAAGAFLAHLRGLHPEWFQQPAPAGSLVTYQTANASFGSSGGGGSSLSPIRVQQQQQQQQRGAGAPAAAAAAPPAGAAAEAAGGGHHHHHHHDHQVMEIDLVAGVAVLPAVASGAGGQQGLVADVRGTVAPLVGADTASSPFVQQDKADSVQAEQEQAAAQQGEEGAAGEEEEEEAGGLAHTLRGVWRKYKALLWRELLITTRNPADVGGRMMTFTYVSLLSGLISWNLPGGADSIMNRISVAYAVLSFYLLMPFVFMSLFTSDKRFFAADTTARLYHPAQYYAAKATVTLPFNMLVAVVFHLIYYGMTGMRHGAAPMAQSCVISLIMGVTAMQAVYCCAIVASSQDLAFVYAIAWTALNLLVNPYMALFNLYSLGWGFSWLRYLSPYNYAWQALVQIELKDRGFDCNAGSGLRVLGLIPDLLPQGPSFSLVRNNLANLAGISTNRQCVASGNAVISMYTTGLSFGATVGILLGYFLLFMAVTYYVVWKSSKRRGPTL